MNIARFVFDRWWRLSYGSWWLIGYIGEYLEYINVRIRRSLVRSYLFIDDSYIIFLIFFLGNLLINKKVVVVVDFTYGITTLCQIRKLPHIFLKTARIKEFPDSD